MQPSTSPQRALLTYRWERLREDQRQRVSRLVAAEQQRHRDRVHLYARLLVLALVVLLLFLLLAALQGSTF